MKWALYFLNNGGKKGIQGRSRVSHKSNFFGSMRKKKHVLENESRQLKKKVQVKKKLQDSLPDLGEQGLFKCSPHWPQTSFPCYWNKYFSNSQLKYVYCPLSIFSLYSTILDYLNCWSEFMFLKSKLEIPLITIKVTKFYRKQQVRWDLAAIQNTSIGKVQGILAPKSTYNTTSSPPPPFIMADSGFCLCANNCSKCFTCMRFRLHSSYYDAQFIGKNNEWLLTFHHCQLLKYDVLKDTRGLCLESNLSIKPETSQLYTTRAHTRAHVTGSIVLPGTI